MFSVQSPSNPADVLPREGCMQGPHPRAAQQQGAAHPSVGLLLWSITLQGAHVPTPRGAPSCALHAGGFWVLAPVLLSACGGTSKGLSASPGDERQPSHPPSRNLPNHPPPSLLCRALPWCDGWRAQGEQHPQVGAHTEGTGSRMAPRVLQPSGAVGGLESPTP